MSRVPALPLDEAGVYMAVAYVAFVLLLGVYTTIIGRKVARNERQIMRLSESVSERAPSNRRELRGGGELLEREPAR
jgi:hypothetical protein